MSRYTFPEISTKKFLKKENLPYLHHVYLEKISSKFKRRSEIDFIVFHKRGLLLLESKGGDRYERSIKEQKDGKKLDVWTYYEGDKKLYSQNRSPFEQITENLEDLRDLLRKHDPKFNKICFAKGVVFPDLKLSDGGILTNSEEIAFDKNDTSFSNFIDRCFDAEYLKKEPNFYLKLDNETQKFIEKTLFPDEPIELEEPHEFRDYSLKKIKKYLYGPSWKNVNSEEISTYPGELYSTGRLHPFIVNTEDIDAVDDGNKEIDNPTDHNEPAKSEWVDSDESTISNDHNSEEGEANNDVSRTHSIMNPSSMGLYFSVPLDIKIEIVYGFSIYEKDSDKRTWKREPYLGKKSIELNKQSYKNISTDNNEIINIEIRSHIRDSVQHVGIYLVNKSTDVHVYQVGLKVKIVNASLIPQEPIVEDLADGSLFDDINIYGVGKGVAANWNKDFDEIWSEYLPEYNVPKIESKSDEGVNLSIKFLSDPNNNLSQDAYSKNLLSFSKNYYDHLVSISGEQLSKEQKLNLEKANVFLDRINKGIHYLTTHDDAFKAFKLMNLSILTMFARKSKYNGKTFYETNPNEREPTWYAFQIAFCLAAIPGIVDPINEKNDREIVDLIWFPTGGGKTESYLALLSFTIFIRRLKDNKNIGTSVIMRYTLRLLVQDQFSRLASLTIAMDYIRKIKFDNIELGSEQITLGYWVGQAASPPNIAAVNSVVSQCISYKKNQLPFVLDRCPWCDDDLVTLDPNQSFNPYSKTLLKQNNGKPSCLNNDCGYSLIDKTPLPILLWEEEILKNPPSIIISTVDNFAKLSWNKYNTQNFFKYNNAGFECDPPDLIIQDELHLISGPLGSLVGLYDQLLTTLCSRIYPVKIAVSSATISNADQQISRLYENRDHQVIPPPEIKWGNSFFMSINDDPNLSRKYLGVFNASQSPVVGSLNTAAALLQSSSFRDDITTATNKAIDPYKTLVWYFNSIRELAYSISSRWNIESRVNYLSNTIDLALGSKYKRDFKYANLQELTSRKSAPEIKNIKENLTNKFKQDYDVGDKKAVDVLFATNMISVGVDIERLGLMMVNGLPKTSSEYIQASSRVGRKHPGLVITSYNVNKSRDRSHYEYFRPMHEGLYRYVEPTSVTPFSAGARKKGLAGIFFAYLMHSSPSDSPSSFTSDELNRARDWIIGVVERASPNEKLETLKKELNQIIKKYLNKQDEITDWGNMRGNDDSSKVSLMGTFTDSNKKDKRHIFDVLTSLRNVDRDVAIEIYEDN